MTYEKVHFNPAVAKTMTRKQFIMQAKVGTPHLSPEQLGEAWDIMMGVDTSNKAQQTIPFAEEKQVVTDSFQEKKQVSGAVSSLISSVPETPKNTAGKPE